MKFDESVALNTYRVFDYVFSLGVVVGGEHRKLANDLWTDDS